MKLEGTMLSEISQMQKNKYHIFSHMRKLKTKNKNKDDLKIENGLLERGKGSGRERRAREVGGENAIKVQSMRIQKHHSENH